MGVDWEGKANLRITSANNDTVQYRFAKFGQTMADVFSIQWTNLCCPLLLEACMSEACLRLALSIVTTVWQQPPLSWLSPMLLPLTVSTSNNQIQQYKSW